MLKLFSRAKYLNFNIYKLAALITMGHKKGQKWKLRPVFNPYPMKTDVKIRRRFVMQV